MSSIAYDRLHPPKFQKGKFNVGDVVIYYSYLLNAGKIALHTVHDVCEDYYEFTNDVIDYPFRETGASFELLEEVKDKHPEYFI